MNDYHWIALTVDLALSTADSSWFQSYRPRS
jgi:hypothetical protein